jgi:hypothetical protein
LKIFVIFGQLANQLTVYYFNNRILLSIFIRILFKIITLEVSYGF